jgi:hypothetical protein
MAPILFAQLVAGVLCLAIAVGVCKAMVTGR